MEMVDFQFTDKKVGAKIQLKKISKKFVVFSLIFLYIFCVKKGGLLE